MIRRELIAFLIVGSLTVLIDFLSYRGLMWSGLVDVGAAKAGGFLTGTLFAYFANKTFTFGHHRSAPGSAWRFGLLYALSLGANVGVNTLSLHALSGLPMAVQGAFLIATGVSTCINFVGMKLFVFRAHSPVETL